MNELIALSLVIMKHFAYLFGQVVMYLILAPWFGQNIFIRLHSPNKNSSVVLWKIKNHEWDKTRVSTTISRLTLWPVDLCDRCWDSNNTTQKQPTPTKQADANQLISEKNLQFTCDRATALTVSEDTNVCAEVLWAYYSWAEHTKSRLVSVWAACIK